MAERRPLRSRGTRWAGALAAALARRGIPPDRISQAGLGVALIAALAFWGSGPAGPALSAALLVLAAAAVQLRLLCNLMDGMVAVEGGQAGPEGPFWNEAPDRLADVLILAGAGLAAGAPALGLVAGVLAVGTAWLREFGRAEGFPADFAGPMAKPQRMAAVTLGALGGAAEALAGGGTLVLALALWAVVLGAAATLWRRSARLLRRMRARGPLPGPGGGPRTRA